MLLLFHLSHQCCRRCFPLARFAVRCLVVSWLRQPGWICVSFHVRTPCVCSIVWHKPWYILWFSIPCSELPRGMLLFLENRDAALFAWHEPLLIFHLHASLCFVTVLLVSACAPHCAVRWSSLPMSVASLALGPSWLAFSTLIPVLPHCHMMTALHLCRSTRRCNDCLFRLTPLSHR